MSVQASLEIKFSELFTPSELLSAFLGTDWETDHDDSISLLPPECFANGEWITIKSPTEQTMIKWFDAFQSKGGEYGFLFVHKSGIGGSFIVHEDWSSIIWSINVNRPCFDSFPRLTDFTSCINVIWKTILLLNKQPLSITCFQDL